MTAVDFIGSVAISVSFGLLILAGFRVIDLVQRSKRQRGARMACEKIQKVIDSVKFGYPLKAWNARYEVYPHAFADGAVRVDFLVDVPHRDNGRIGPLTSPQIFDCYLVEQMSESMMLAQLRELAKKTMLHEVDESILVNGARLFDPHKAEVL